MTQAQALSKLAKIRKLAESLDNNDGSELSSLMANIESASDLAIAEVAKHFRD